MKKIALFLILVMLISLVSCEREYLADELISDFVSAYRAEGVIYSYSVMEGELGYVCDGFLERIFVFYGELPRNFALLLNSHADYGAECGVFVCDGIDELEIVSEACLERMRILDKSGEYSLLIRTKNTVFYSTLRDKERAGNIWRQIIG